MSSAIVFDAITEAVRLGVEIREAHEAVESSAASTIEHAIRCGELLIQAKATVGHGAWGAWLEENFPGSQETARKYMRLSEGRALLSNSKSPCNLTVDGAVRLIAEARKPRRAAKPAERTEERDVEESPGSNVAAVDYDEDTGEVVEESPSRARPLRDSHVRTASEADAFEREVIERVNRGEPVRDICEAMDCSVSSVSYVKTLYGLSKDKRKAKGGALDGMIEKIEALADTLDSASSMTGRLFPRATKGDLDRLQVVIDDVSKAARRLSVKTKKAVERQ